MAVRLDEAEKQILAGLLADFSDRALSSNQLSGGYIGPLVSDLAMAICIGGEVTRVDFDIAFSDLESKKLISTGPYALVEKDPSSGVIFIGGYSKREYAGLTELGYKTARLSPNKPKHSVQRVVNNVHISGGQFSNMQLAAGSIIEQRMDSVSGADGDVLTRLITILENQGQAVSVDQRKDLAIAVESAMEGNGKEAKSLVEKVCGPAWGAVQPVIWPIFGDLLKKSLGL
ncbi:hypothetical protein [Pseudomonas syringae]|uniref:Uncharacterized protein n=1 Tax=Pseudomonas syringae pv. actinidiae TaxID=103796 RepID=A0A286JZX1_PSESF|nr:hypothetical protein [Pseudomonas syringae]PHX42952.1 hypothetical protein AO263_06620 [Pseudomonas sp. NZIPFR-PS5]AMW88345.1 hypothetical protein [Pseudomonas syringae pv. actinidiae]OKS58518.1 hypothetical protein PsaNZ66_03120 [Pseudomonas syringae pv. actinidiae]OKS79682.1 hypothetical protein PsaNZ65_03195 [Pseudomonas syringae pv. actinidiae]OSO70512.1 hypothetical protein BV367_00644 [Pseudomonas syringae pv. actinidiae]